MRIGIDARLYNQTGVGRYIRNIISQLESIDNVNEYYVYLRKSEFRALKFNNPKFQKKLLDVKWHSFLEQIIAPLKFYRDNIDVMHFPYFNVPIFYRGKYLLTIHDLIIDHFDTGRASTWPLFVYKFKRLAYKIITNIAIRNAKAISAISKTTKSEIIDHYHMTPSSITVTYDALDKNFLLKMKVQKPIRYFNFPYVLYVGNAYPHKNLERLIQSWRMVLKKTQIKLVLAGDDKFFYPRLIKYAQKLKISNEIVFYGEAKDEELINLYSHAKCLVFPSFMEGFGLPNFEALACNSLPVVSNIPVFREIWSDKLIYFNPYSINDLKDKILKVLAFPKNIYNDRVLKAKKRIYDFSWKKTAKDTLALYYNIYQNYK